MSRGSLSEMVQAAAEKHIGRKVSLRELRLIPYIQYIMVNEQKLDPNRISQEEREVLRTWKDAGYMEGGAGGLSITREFWDFMCEILFISYVAQRE